MAFELISSVFVNGETIPERFSCDGKDLSPPLEWKDVPGGTESLVLVMDDPDAPGGTWTHWVLFDIPPGTQSLLEGETVGKEGLNSWGRRGYGGPCPPRGHGVHRYFFTLYALTEAATVFSECADSKKVIEVIRDKIIAKAELMGRYGRE